MPATVAPRVERFSHRLSGHARRRLAIRLIFAVAACWIWLGYADRASACYAVIAGARATVDGSVLVGHNEQNSGPRTLNLRRTTPRTFRRREFGRLRRNRKKRPTRPVAGRYAAVLDACLATSEEGETGMLWSQTTGVEYGDAYLNDYGVAVTSDSCPSREDDVAVLVARGEIRHGGIGYMLRRLVARHARTARQGVEIAGRLVERLGYRGSGRTYVIADPHEAWLVAVVRGRRWAAQRVPDQAVVLLPNVHILGELNLDDSSRFLASPDLVSYAVRRGWFDPAAGEPFCFWKAYGAPRAGEVDPRQALGQQLVTGHNDIRPGAPLPLAVSPRHKLRVADVCTILRYADGRAPLSTPLTQEGTVFQLRSDLPPGVGCVYWRATAEPATSVFTPWYLGIDRTPDAYARPADAPADASASRDGRSAWWTFRMLQDRVREGSPAGLARVQAVWQDLEQAIRAEQPSVETEAARLRTTHPTAASEFLGRRCAHWAQTALDEARCLAAGW